MAVELTDAQRRTISALADTFVAAVPSPVNPMVTCLAMARRTATNIIDAA